MGRLITAALIGLMGAVALVMSAIQPWYGDTDPKASMLLPLVAAAGIVVLALVLRSKLLMALAGVVGLATGILWFVRLDRDDTSSTFQFTDFSPGLWSASAALVLVALATVVLPRRAAR